MLDCNASSEIVRKVKEEGKWIGLTRQFLKMERLNVPNKSWENQVSRLLWNTMEHFMLNEINKWKQNGITTELDNNTFAQPNNVRASFTFVINAEIEWAYTFKWVICYESFFTWRFWRS